MGSKKYYLFLVVSIIFLFLITNVFGLGLNYQTTSITVNSSEEFCLENYNLFNTAQQKMSGYLTVGGDLAVFLPYYDLVKEKLEKQERIQEINERMNELKESNQDQEELGRLDQEKTELEFRIKKIDEDIYEKEKKRIIEVPALPQEILDKYMGDSAGLRQYLRDNNLIISAELCLNAPNIQEELGENCYTKFYRGEVVLIPASKDDPLGSGSTVSFRVSAPLEITVKCQSSNTRAKADIYVIIIVIVLVVLLSYFIYRILKKRKKKKW